MKLCSVLASAERSSACDIRGPGDQVQVRFRPQPEPGL